ncbi:predicted protein, partial [Arabidopsis lyrata subsp. lyrata]
LFDAYLSVLKALLHASVACRKKLEVDWVPACDLEKETAKEVMRHVDYTCMHLLRIQMRIKLLESCSWSSCTWRFWYLAWNESCCHQVCTIREVICLHDAIMQTAQSSNLILNIHASYSCQRFLDSLSFSLLLNFQTILSSSVLNSTQSTNPDPGKLLLSVHRSEPICHRSQLIAASCGELDTVMNQASVHQHLISNGPKNVFVSGTSKKAPNGLADVRYNNGYCNGLYTR